MYGLPDSAIYGTYKRLTRKRRRVRLESQPFAWLWGWAILALIYGLGRVVITLT